MCTLSSYDNTEAPVAPSQPLLKLRHLSITHFCLHVENNTQKAPRLAVIMDWLKNCVELKLANQSYAVVYLNIVVVVFLILKYMYNSDIVPGVTCRD